jgi:hypothetical protein
VRRPTEQMKVNQLQMIADRSDYLEGQSKETSLHEADGKKLSSGTVSTDSHRIAACLMCVFWIS